VSVKREKLKIKKKEVMMSKENYKREIHIKERVNRFLSLAKYASFVLFP
jgi:hypothetical protein